MRRKLIVCAVLTLGALMPAAARAGDKDIVEYRQNLMKTMGAQAAAIGAITQNKVPHNDNLALHAEIIAINARAALKAFEPAVAGGAAKADVWENWGDFSKRLQALSTAAEGVAQAARAGGEPPKVMAMLTCKGCHDIYRSK